MKTSSSLDQRRSVRHFMCGGDVLGMRFFFAPSYVPVAAPVMATSYEPAVGQWGNLFGQAAVVEAKGPAIIK